MSLGCLKRVKDLEVAKAVVLHTLIIIMTTTTKVQNFGAMARDVVCSCAKETTHAGNQLYCLKQFRMFSSK